MASLTIFTPAFNRAHTLPRTYESLCQQTCKDFVWMIVDDGSSDNTQNLVERWISEDLIPIIYISQQNQGMHGAHNTAYRNIHTELNTCIDSDDWMPNDAVENILKIWNHLNESERKQYAGIIALDQTANGEIIGKGFPEDLDSTTLTGYYAKGGKGDKKLIYRTDVITSYPEYPIFEGEKYVGLAYKYMLVDQDLPLLCLNKAVCTVEYQPDGSSYSMYKQYWNNPKGFAFYRKTEMICTPKISRRFLVCAHYVSSSIISRNRNFLKESPLRVLTFFSIPLGFALYLRIKGKVRKNKKMEIAK